jgi:hypothetical protein
MRGWLLGLEQFGNPEEAEYPPVEAVTRILLKIVTEWEDLVCSIMVSQSV